MQRIKSLIRHDIGSMQGRDAASRSPAITPPSPPHDLTFT
jgi:hypothetical protein